MMNFQLSPKLVPEVTNPFLLAAATTCCECSPVRLVRLELKPFWLPNSMTPAITARPTTATTNSTRWNVKYRLVPDASRTPAATMISAPIQNTPWGLATL